jgi:hypothetical protein
MAKWTSKRHRGSVEIVFGYPCGGLIEKQSRIYRYHRKRAVRTGRKRKPWQEPAAGIISSDPSGRTQHS